MTPKIIFTITGHSIIHCEFNTLTLNWRQLPLWSFSYLGKFLLCSLFQFVSVVFYRISICYGDAVLNPVVKISIFLVMHFQYMSSSAVSHYWNLRYLSIWGQHCRAKGTFIQMHPTVRAAGYSRQTNGDLHDMWVPIKLKDKFYRTMVESALLDGMECWAIQRDRDMTCK